MGEYGLVTMDTALEDVCCKTLDTYSMVYRPTRHISGHLGDDDGVTAAGGVTVGVTRGGN